MCVCGTKKEGLDFCSCCLQEGLLIKPRVFNFDWISKKCDSLCSTENLAILGRFESFAHIFESIHMNAECAGFLILCLLDIFFFLLVRLFLWPWLVCVYERVCRMWFIYHDSMIFAHKHYHSYPGYCHEFVLYHPNPPNRSVPFVIAFAFTFDGIWKYL